jgi:uncharacterized protein YdhG (YjbR/CyaY superfamily)
MKRVESVAEYFASIPPGSRVTLNKLRKVIRAIVPKATEVISYGIPTFKYGRMLVAYGAFSHHCSFFPLSSAIMKRFDEELSRYDTSRGTIRFPVDTPLPASLVKKIVRARLEQNRMRDQISLASKSSMEPARKFELPAGLAKPAQGALAAARIGNLRQLSRWKEHDVRQLHGIGPNAMVLLSESLRSNGLSFARSRR